MDLDTQGKPMDQRERQAGDDKIGVITLMRLIWKWKILILAGTLVCALVALVISALMPHVYKVDTLVENVQIGTDKAGEKVYLGNFQNIRNLISAGAFNQDILDSLREQYKDALPRRISFKVSLENNKQFVRIGYDAEDVEMGKKLVSQLFKRLQERNLIRIEHWKKELDRKIEDERAKISDMKAQIDKKKEEIVLAEKTEYSMKQEMLSRAKVDKRAYEDKIKQLQKRIGAVAVKRNIDMSKAISDMKAKKSKTEYMVKIMDKRNTEIKSNIKFIESEIDFLAKTRKELLSMRNETRNMDVVGELSSVIMDGNVQLTKLRQKVFINDDLISANKIHIRELNGEINRLINEREVTPKEIEVLNDSIRQARLDMKALESPAKKISDEMDMLSSTDKLSSSLEADIAKASENVALTTEEIGTLEANKKNVKNIVVLQRPISSVSPLRPDTKRNVVIGAVVGLFLALFLSVFLEYVYKREA